MPFLTAAIIRAVELNAGWLTAALLCLLIAIAITIYPSAVDIVPRVSDEDIWIGLAMAFGFFLIGRFLHYVDR